MGLIDLGRCVVQRRFLHFSRPVLASEKYTERLTKPVRVKNIKWSKIDPKVNIGGTYYEMFDVDLNVTREELSKARLRLLREHHPDKGGVAKTFEVIEKGFKVLSDPEKKQKYDRAVLYFGEIPTEDGRFKKGMLVAVCAVFVCVPFFVIKPLYEHISRPTWEKSAELAKQGSKNDY